MCVLGMHACACCVCWVGMCVRAGYVCVCVCWVCMCVHAGYVCLCSMGMCVLDGLKGGGGRPEKCAEGDQSHHQSLRNNWTLFTHPYNVSLTMEHVKSSKNVHLEP